MKKLNKKDFNIIICIISAILGILAFLANKYYLRPYLYKKEIYNEFRYNDKNLTFSDEQAWGFAECMYEKLHAKYGDIKNFPGYGGKFINKFFYKTLWECSAANDIYEKKDSLFIMTHLDSLAKESFLLDLKQGNVFIVDD
jgi:hypothetical protein